MPGCYAAFHKQLGDLTLLEPALSRLRDFHGEPVRLFTRGGHAPLVELMPGVRFTRPPVFLPTGDMYCFDPLSKSAFRSLTTPVWGRYLIIPERRELQWFHPWIFAIPRSPELGDSYVAEFFWQHTPVPSTSPFRMPILSRPPDSWAPVGVSSRSFILVNATAGWRTKLWSPTGWAETIRSLDGISPVLLTSGGQDWQVRHCDEIVSLIGNGPRVLPTSLREFLWLCANARAVLTVDGSASHFAAAFGTPSLTLFGPTNSKNWHRPGPQRIAICAPVGGEQMASLRDFGPDPVIAATRELSLA
jgi:ADP-heptose:LPS heptosyltransferase